MTARKPVRVACLICSPQGRVCICQPPRDANGRKFDSRKPKPKR